MSLMWVVRQTGGERFDDRHRVFQQGDAVARVEARADMGRVEPPEDRDQLVGAPILVVLDREARAISGRDRRGHGQGAGRRLRGASEGGGGRIRLVPPPAQHDRPDHGRAGAGRGADLGFEPAQVVAVAGEADVPLQVHPERVGPGAEPVAPGLVARADADLHAPGPGRVGEFEERGGVVEPLGIAPGARGREALAI